MKKPGRRANHRAGKNRGPGGGRRVAVPGGEESDGSAPGAPSEEAEAGERSPEVQALEAQVRRLRALPAADRERIHSELRARLAAEGARREADRALWRDGQEPIPFDEFCERVDGQPLTERQRRVFADPDMLRALHLVRPERTLQEWVLCWGKGCLAGETPLTDARTGETRAAAEWERRAQPLTVRSWDGRRVVESAASAVFLKGTAPLLRVTLADGRTLRVTAGHRVRTPGGWREAADLRAGADVVQVEDGFTRVARVAPDGEGTVYDLTVPATGCYFDAAGVLSHNSGKDYLAAKFIAYLAYVVCHLRGDPAEFFGLAPGTQLSILNVAPTEVLARQVFFRYLRGFVAGPLLAPFAPDIRADEIRLRQAAGAGEPFLVLYSKHSNSAGLDGYNLIGWVMDEADAFQDGAKASNAEEIHGILRSSCNTRLGTRWVGVVISYPRVEAGFMMRLMEEGRRNIERYGPDASYFVDQAATWDVRPGVSPEDPGIRADYERDPAHAASLYECLPMATGDAFFDMPERIEAAVDRDRPPVAHVTEHLFETADAQVYVSAEISSIRRQPGHRYFLGVDGGWRRDSFALSVFHADGTPDAFKWLCRACGDQERIRRWALYVRRPGNSWLDTPPGARRAVCGACGVLPEQTVVNLNPARQFVGLWWERQDPERDGLIDGHGQPYRVRPIREDLLVRITPRRRTRPGEPNAPVFFPGMEQLCRRLMEELGVERAGMDPYQTVQLMQGLRRDVGGDIAEVPFSAPEQFRRARLVKSLLHAGLLSLQPSPERDREWRRLVRVGQSKIDHPPGESKDLFDAESIAIWLAATAQDSQLAITWV